MLDRLIEQYQYRLFRYLLYICGDRETAEDVFQETWIRVLKRGNQYDSRCKFETWLFAIARHLVIDLERRKKFRRLDTRTDADQKSPRDLPAVNSPVSVIILFVLAQAIAIALNWTGVSNNGESWPSGNNSSRI
jgi:RNA polymerase sigma-70 factor, ECF subfamily